MPSARWWTFSSGRQTEMERKVVNTEYLNIIGYAHANISYAHCTVHTTYYILYKLFNHSQGFFYSFVRSFFSLHFCLCLFVSFVSLRLPNFRIIQFLSIQFFAHTNLSHLAFESVLNIEHGIRFGRAAKHLQIMFFFFHAATTTYSLNVYR